MSYRQRLRRSLTFAGLLLTIVLGCLGATPAPGASFTSRAAFDAAVSLGTTAVDFEGQTSGTDVSGATLTPPSAEAGVVLPAPIIDPLAPVAGSP